MMRLRWVLLATALAGTVSCASPLQHADSPGFFSFDARRRVETPPGAGTWIPVEEPVQWRASDTAVIVCDMWDADWCKEATRRMNVLAPDVNAFLRIARREGAFIIHAPSGSVSFYADTPQRRRAREAPSVEPPEPIGVRLFDPSREGPFPIDDRKSICPCDPRCRIPKEQANTRQTRVIDIDGKDAITDSGQEVYNLLMERGIRTILFTGVHNNLCVLVRSFGIRQFKRLGFEIILVRDLTEAMYDPRQRPYVKLEAATTLVNEHIEKYWCATALSGDIAPSPIRNASELP